MARGQGRPPAPPPPYEQFNSNVCAEFVQSYDILDEDVRSATNDRVQLKKDWRERGLDWDAMAPVDKLRRKIRNGKISVQDAQARIERIVAYADWALGEQHDLFRDAEKKPDAPAAAKAKKQAKVTAGDAKAALAAAQQHLGTSEPEVEPA